MWMENEDTIGIIFNTLSKSYHSIIRAIFDIGNLLTLNDLVGQLLHEENGNPPHYNYIRMTLKYC
jgi:hypothetical protein